MICFVLHNSREQPLQFPRKCFTRQIIGFYRNFFFPHNRAANSRDAQATLLTFCLTLARTYHRVDEHMLRLFVADITCRIGNKEPVRKVDLVGGETDALVLGSPYTDLGAMDTLLIKGSRSAGMEWVLQQLTDNAGEAH